jgi:hypothetical protein
MVSLSLSEMSPRISEHCVQCTRLPNSDTFQCSQQTDMLSFGQQMTSSLNSSYESTMRFSRNQIFGALILLVALWMVVIYRMLFSGA